MFYFILFIVRFLPFWAIPIAIIGFEMGTYYYNRRERLPTIVFYSTSAFLTILSIIWIVFEGYWRAAPFLRRWFG